MPREVPEYRLALPDGSRNPDCPDSYLDALLDVLSLSAVHRNPDRDVWTSEIALRVGQTLGWARERSLPLVMRRAP